jgi:hypothetical protein
MNRYQTRTPRTLIGMSAAAMTFATIAVLVALPASVGPDRDGAMAVMAATQPTEVRIVPDRIDVYAVREPRDVAEAGTPSTGAALRVLTAGTRSESGNAAEGPGAARHTLRPAAHGAAI